MPGADSTKEDVGPHCHQMVCIRWETGQCSPVLERGGGEGLAELAAGTDSDLYRAVSRRSLKRSAAISALDSSCRGMLLMSEEKGLSGFSRLISQLVFPEGRSTPQAASPVTSPPPALPGQPWFAVLRACTRGLQGSSCSKPRVKDPGSPGPKVRVTPI